MLKVENLLVQVVMETKDHLEAPVLSSNNISLIPHAFHIMHYVHKHTHPFLLHFFLVHVKSLSLDAHHEILLFKFNSNKKDQYSN